MGKPKPVVTKMAVLNAVERMRIKLFLAKNSLTDDKDTPGNNPCRKTEDEIREAFIKAARHLSDRGE